MSFHELKINAKEKLLDELLPLLIKGKRFSFKLKGFISYKKYNKKYFIISVHEIKYK